MTEAAKSRKDLAQASQLLELLREDRPGELVRAAKALPSSMRSRVEATAKTVSGFEPLRDLITR
jgi:hypothetical protein